MASRSPSDVCGVCLDTVQDPRVLPCLHSLCRTCIDQLAVTATDGEFACPICRARLRLPSGIAAGLPKDITVSATSRLGDGSLDCELCHDEKTKKKPTAWCKECRIALCESHAMPHILSASSKAQVHSMVPLSLVSPEGSPGELGFSIEGECQAQCPHHGLPLRYHCGSCDVAICGDCAAIGEHRLHEKIRYIKDIVQDRKVHVAKKVEKLDDVVRKLERSLAAVDDTSTKLGRRANEVRTEIRQAGDKTKAMVEAHVRQMAQEVDDVEEYRHKVLDQQREELKAHLDSARNALHFSKRIMELDIRIQSETLFSLLHALETRAASLLNTHIQEQPSLHHRLMFQAVGDIDLACKTKEGIGKVSTCQALAKHSVIEGGTARTAVSGEAMSLVIRAKDEHGENLDTGGDAVSGKLLSSGCAGDAPPVRVSDNNDGSYTVVCTFPSAGTYRLDVLVNGEKMPGELRITARTDDNAEAHTDAGERGEVDADDEWEDADDDDSDGEEEEEEIVLDALGIDESDIEMVMQQSNASRRQAIEALRNNLLDVLNAILELTM